MKQFVFASVIALGALAMTHQAHAVVCANGVYRAGCAGPNGAVGVHKNYYNRAYGTYHGYHGGAAVRGPNGAAVRGPYGGTAVRRY